MCNIYFQEIEFQYWLRFFMKVYKIFYFGKKFILINISIFQNRLYMKYRNIKYNILYVFFELAF